MKEDWYKFYNPSTKTTMTIGRIIEDGKTIAICDPIPYYRKEKIEVRFTDINDKLIRSEMV